MERNPLEEASPLHLTPTQSSSDNATSHACQQSQCCILDMLLSTHSAFKALSSQEKQDIIVNGRPTPVFSMSTQMKNYVRHFKIEYYSSSKWLTACKSKKKLFCWPCILFETDKGVWNSVGFCDMSNFYKAKSRHERTQSHLSAITKLKTFTRKNVQPSEQSTSDVLKHNAEVDSNREIMKRLIDVTCFLAKQELPFRGHNEHNESLNRGNYIEFLHMLSKYDIHLDSHLQNTKVFKGTSNRIQDDIIESISDSILDIIREEVRDAPFVALMLDEMSDVANLSQLSTIIRYVKEGEIQERFLGFTDVSSNRSAVALSEHVCKILSDFQCASENKFVAQGYDGAATISKNLNGLQALVKKSFPSALFVHFYAHRLNPVLSQSVQFIKECKIFFKTLNGFCSFFSHSVKCVNALNGSEVKKRFPAVSVTHWNYNSRIVNTVHENKQELISFFEHIVDDPDYWDNNAFICARGCLESLKDFTFSFLLEIFSHIFALTDTLLNILQKKTFDVNYCIAKVRETISFIQESRNNFDNMYATVKERNSNEKEGESNDSKMRYKRLYNDIIDTIVTQMETRFRDLEELTFIELLDSKKFKSFKAKFPEILFTTLKSSYKKLFHFENLRSELMAVYRLSDFSGRTVTEIAKFLIDTELGEEGFPEVYKLCCLITTITPLSTSIMERTCSRLKCIKSYVWNTQSQDRLSQLALLSVEKALLHKIQSQRNFYDHVIEKFVQKGDRRIPLMYK